MTGLTLAVVLQLSLAAAAPHSYADAHRTTAETGRPMVVMVSAEWCSACKEMEKTVLPQVAKRGLLKKVSFALVNVDRESTLARRLIGNGPVPQLLMFRRNGNGWLRKKLVGGQTPEAVEKFIEQGVARDEAAKKAPEGELKSFSDEETADTKVADKPKAQPISKH